MDKGSMIEEKKGDCSSEEQMTEQPLPTPSNQSSSLQLLSAAKPNLWNLKPEPTERETKPQLVVEDLISMQNGLLQAIQVKEAKARFRNNVARIFTEMKLKPAEEWAETQHERKAFDLIRKVCFELEPEGVPARWLLVKYRRKDQLCKKFMLTFRRRLFQEAMVMNGGVRREILPVMIVRYRSTGFRIDGDDLDRLQELLSPEAHTWLTRDMTRFLLTFQPIFSSLTSKEDMDNLLAELDRQTIRGIEVNLFRHVDQYFDSLKEGVKEAEAWEVLTNHINDSRICKKPFTFYDNRLTVYQFYSYLLHQAMKNMFAQLLGSPEDQMRIQARVREALHYIVVEMNRFPQNQIGREWFRPLTKGDKCSLVRIDHETSQDNSTLSS